MFAMYFFFENCALCDIALSIPPRHSALFQFLNGKSVLSDLALPQKSADEFDDVIHL